ncbi:MULTISPECIES: multicopper oxidase family protein [unclassified Blastococcus]
MSRRAAGGTGHPGPPGGHAAGPGRRPAGPLSRRALLGGALAALSLPVLTACSGGDAQRPAASPTPRRPAPALADDGTPVITAPPLAPSTVDADGVRVFRLRAQAGTTEFRPGVVTATCGYEGAHLGPTLRARRGERVRVEVVNELLEDTTLHWHGMELPGAADGGPHVPIPPGGSAWPSWTVAQPAATLWYHPHPHGGTTAQVLRGLAGAFLVDDPAAAPAGLPAEYGVDDVPLLLQDQRLTADGRIDEETRTAIGPLGDVVLVNGVAGGCLPVTTTRIRLRVVNASPARVYALAAADGRELALVGTDGGLLAAPVPVRSVRLSPGERAEVVVPVAPGERVALVSLPPDLGLAPQLSVPYGAADTLPLLELRAAAELTPSPELPAVLADVPPADAGAATTDRSFALSANRINGQAHDPARIDLRVPLGATEVWTVTSEHEQPHSFHPHGVRFRVLSVAGAAPPPELAGWKDTVYVPPRTPLRLLVGFAQPADERAPFMYHCHVLWHEDQGMMGQFVVEPA